MRFSLKSLFFVALTAFAFGCDSDDDAANPSNGTVKGSVSPANGASQVFLVTGTDTIKGTPAADGTYELKDVKPGDYQISAKANANFMAPAASAVSVTAGNTTDVPVITLTALPANGSASVSIGGTTYSGTPTFAGFGNGTLFYLSNGNQIHITLPAGISGPGTFTTSATSDLEFKVINNSSGATWSTDATGGTGTLTVSSYNATTKKGSATFSFTAVPTMGGTGTKVGTNGTLLNVRLRN